MRENEGARCRGKLVVDELRGAMPLGLPRTARQLLADGASFRAAARALKVPEGTIRRAAQQDSALRPSHP